MDRSGVWSSLVACIIAFGASASPAEAQGWFFDAAFDQAFSSSDPLRTPGGFTVSTGAVAVWGPLGLHATFRSISDGGEDVLQDCGDGSESCVPGRLSVSYRMRSAGVGISYDFINPTDVMLTLGLMVTKDWRTEQIDHGVTGARFVDELASTLGLSASAHLRLRPLLGGLRPAFTVHYDHSGGGTCGAGAACWQGHDAVGVSVGFSWVVRRPPQD